MQLNSTKLFDSVTPGRWAAGSAQQSNKFGMFPVVCIIKFHWSFINTPAYFMDLHLSTVVHLHLAKASLQSLQS